MAQTIITKYLPATNTRGSRIKATCWKDSVTVPFNYGLSDAERFQAAANALCAKMSDDTGFWQVIMGAEMPAGDGYAFIVEHFQPA